MSHRRLAVGLALLPLVLPAATFALVSRLPSGAVASATLALGPEPLMEEVARVRLELGYPSGDTAQRRNIVADGEIFAAAARIGQPDAVSRRRLPRLGVELRPLTREVAVTVAARRADESVRLTNAFVVALVEERERTLDRAFRQNRSRAALLAVLGRQEDVALERQLQRLDVLRRVPGAGLTPAVPARASDAERSPRIWRDTIAAGVLGALLAASGFAISNRLRRGRAAHARVSASEPPEE